MAALGEIVKGTVRYTQLGASDLLNVFYWVVTAADLDGEVLDTIVNWIENDWGPAWADFASEEASILGFDADIVNLDGTVARSLGSELTPVQGLSNAVIGVGPIAGYIQADTAEPRSRGRKFVPGYPDDAIDQGRFDLEAVGDLALMLAAWLEVLSGMDTLELTPGIPSRTLVEFLPFIGSGSFTDVPAVQRRRKPNVGS
jgi:hypothetical protein